MYLLKDRILTELERDQLMPASDWLIFHEDRTVGVIGRKI